MTTCDVFDQFKDRADTDDRESVQVLVAPWRVIGGRSAFAGRVATARCFNDNTLLRQALSTPGDGRVLVVDGAGSVSHALMGDALGALALRHGWAGVIVYGAVRDSAALAALDLGVLALGTVPRPSRKEGAGAADAVLDICGAKVSPGDIIVADTDGVVVIAGATEMLPGLLP
nr:ribonuclease E activity regulator RraA [Dermacoccus sp. Ellin185]